MPTTASKGLGRRQPADWQHIAKYPVRALFDPTAAAPEVVEHVIHVPRYRRQYNQGDTGACVGYSLSWLMSTLNHKLYNAPALWAEARVTDEFSTNDDLADDQQGTTVRAGLEVLRTKGHVALHAGKSEPWRAAEGIDAYRWVTDVADIRGCIADERPVVLGINWYQAFFRPEKKGHDSWIGRQADWGPVEGGHAIMCYGWSDKRNAVKLDNSWGAGWPLVWLPVPALERLLNEDGECAVVTDK